MQYSATSVIRTPIFRNLDYPVLKSQKLLKVNVQLQLCACAIATCSIARGYYNNYTIALQLSGLIQLSGTLLKIFGQRGPDNGGCTVHVYIIMYRTNIYICITLSVRTIHTYLLPYQYVSHCQNVLAIPTYYRTNIYICITLSVRTSHTYLLALASCTGNSPLEQRARKELDCMTQIRQSDGKST